METRCCFRFLSPTHDFPIDSTSLPINTQSRESETQSRVDEGERGSPRPTNAAHESAENVSAAGVGIRLAPWVICIAVLMVLGTLYLASSLFVPLTIALIAYLTLRPVTAKLCQLGIGQTLAAALLISGCFLIIGGVAAVLYDPLQSWLKEAPQSMGRLSENFESVAQPLTTLDRAGDQLDEATTDLDQVAGEASASEQEITVSFDRPSVIDRQYLINTTGHVLAFIGAVAVLTFFMLSTGDELLNRILNLMPDQEQRQETLATIGDIQDNVGSYLVQITIINIGLGLAVTAVMWAVGMPTPALWGAMATLFNFVPYLGPIGGTLIVLVAASTQFDSFTRSVGVAAAFWCTTAVEGQFVTPYIIGKTLKVGSLVVLVAVAFWGFLWGLPGVFLAVPMLIVKREICSSFRSTFPLAVVLGEDPCQSPKNACDEAVREDQPLAETV